MTELNAGWTKNIGGLPLLLLLSDFLGRIGIKQLVSRCCSSINFANFRTVGAVNKADSLIVFPSFLLMKRNNLVASSECPPNSKKSSSMPIDVMVDGSGA